MGQEQQKTLLSQALPDPRSRALLSPGIVLDAPPHGRVVAVLPSKPRLFRPEGLAREPASSLGGLPRPGPPTTPTRRPRNLHFSSARPPPASGFKSPAPPPRSPTLLWAPRRRRHPHVSARTPKPPRPLLPRPGNTSGFVISGEKRPPAAGDPRSRGNTC